MSPIQYIDHHTAPFRHFREGGNPVVEIQTASIEQQVG
jgi:hypothetical protein